MDLKVFHSAEKQDAKTRPKIQRLIPPLFAKHESVCKSYDWNYGKQK